MKGLLVILCITFAAPVTKAAELLLSGSYQGQDVYVRNPYNPSSNKFCTKSVYVNDRLVVERPMVSAYKIDLSFLKLNDLVVIRIIYEEGCKPAIVNPHVLKNTAAGFRFLTSEADNNSISWMTEGDEKGGVFILEQKTEEKEWTEVARIPSKGELHSNQYTIKAPHEKGENSYRLKYQNTKNEQTYSVEMAYTRSEKITFYPTVATDLITLSDTAKYVITDYFGKEVKQGEGIKISVADLKPGGYYITIQNRKEKFVKK